MFSHLLSCHNFYYCRYEKSQEKISLFEPTRRDAKMLTWVKPLQCFMSHEELQPSERRATQCEMATMQIFCRQRIRGSDDEGPTFQLVKMRRVFSYPFAIHYGHPSSSSHNHFGRISKVHLSNVQKSVMTWAINRCPKS